MTLTDYEGPHRQLTITDLGHEEPTLLLTNQLDRSAAKLIGRYAQRMLIENNIEDGDRLLPHGRPASAVALKVNCDLQLTLMASSLYRLLAPHRQRLREREVASPVPDFIDATATIEIDEDEILVQFQKRAHNPCWSPPGSTRPPLVFPGWVASGCGSSSDSLILAPRPSMV